MDPSRGTRLDTNLRICPLGLGPCVAKKIALALEIVPVLATNVVRPHGEIAGSAVMRHADSRDRVHRVRGLRGHVRLSRLNVESAAGARGLGADALRWNWPRASSNSSNR